MELVRCQTNSANDSEGAIWGLPGNTFLALVASLVLSVTLLVVLQTRHFSPLVALGVAALPTAVTVTYITCLIAGKPRHYDRDFFDLLASGKDFSLNPLRQPVHPLDHTAYDRVKRPQRVLR